MRGAGGPTTSLSRTTPSHSQKDPGPPDVPALRR
eukprot:CAMPEP_0183306522 /NCGR_PEP_ID=MMETSP0160_2-20130417/12215_1 /TAXON_ID=2839 ORGANISM="Odontella Sinensis, Strain Grunow 1884" /NCGR_SAMPLE_ID=MMETSP0160_2 /ASSEMBLY_ACC=CAM_ASM_000250 /LENGTH=33 /DNA_ID= /DNA_START= /DNA_END= /DNA_ORIENTATION=